MAEARQDGPRFLYERDAATTDVTASVDVADLLTRLAEQTEALAEARVRQKYAEAALKRKTREMEEERKAHSQTRQRLETDCRELEAECNEVTAECRDLQAEAARERKARAVVEADLKRAQDEVAALQHQAKVAWAQLQQGGSQAEHRPWWARLGS
jgi:chromosome segregation ATPase